MWRERIQNSKCKMQTIRRSQRRGEYRNDVHPDVAYQVVGFHVARENSKFKMQDANYSSFAAARRISQRRSPRCCVSGSGVSCGAREFKIQNARCKQFVVRSGEANITTTFTPMLRIR